MFEQSCTGQSSLAVLHLTDTAVALAASPEEPRAGKPNPGATGQPAQQPGAAASPSSSSHVWQGLRELRAALSPGQGSEVLG